MYLFVKQAVDDEEEGALLGVQNYKQDLKEKVCLVETQNPGTAQYDKLGHNLEQNHPAEEKGDFHESFREMCVSAAAARDLWKTWCLWTGKRHFSCWPGWVSDTRESRRTRSSLSFNGKKNTKVRQRNWEDPQVEGKGGCGSPPRLLESFLNELLVSMTVVRLFIVVCDRFSSNLASFAIPRCKS